MAMDVEHRAVSLLPQLAKHHTDHATQLADRMIKQLGCEEDELLPLVYEAEALLKFDPQQPRDAIGQWTAEQARAQAEQQRQRQRQQEQEARARKPKPKQPGTLHEGIGMKGPPDARVRDAQDQLAKLGYNLGKPGADGRFGPITARAVTEFQQDHGLKGDGTLGPKTQKLLARLAAEAKPKKPKPKPKG